jgi:hypothetical protein
MANTPFKLKSGNTTPFKQMGSSKVLQAKIAKEFKLPVSQKSSMPKNFNIKGDPSTTPGFSETKIGKAKKVKVNTNPGNYFTKSRDAAGSQLGKKPTVLSEIKRGVKTPDMGTKASSRLSNVARGFTKAAKVGSKLLGGLAVGATLYDFYKSGQKHSGGKAVKGQKSFIAEAKKKTKSIFKK